MYEITLLLNRRARHLWIVIDGNKTSVEWDIDGVVNAGNCEYYRVMRKGIQVGIVWDVKEVREEW